MRNKFLLCLLLCAFTISVSAKDWSRVVRAIAKVESNCDPHAVSGIYVGYLQIAPVIVKDCNRILKIRKSSLRYSLADRYSKSKSIQMFVLYQSFYNPKGSVEKAIRLWNGGPNYSHSATQRYYQRVIYHYRKQ